MAATTYYIDGVSGNDTTGDGSSGNPWATIQKGVDETISNGDSAGGNTIYVRTATYTEAVTIANTRNGVDGTGTYNKILPDTGASPVIDGENTRSIGVKFNDGTQYWLIAGFEIKNHTDYGIKCGDTASTSAVQNGQNVIGCYLHDNGSDATAGNSNIFTTSYFGMYLNLMSVDAGEHGIYTSGGQQVVIQGVFDSSGRLGDRHLGDDIRHMCNICRNSDGAGAGGGAFSSSLQVAGVGDNYELSRNVWHDNADDNLRDDNSAGTHPHLLSSVQYNVIYNDSPTGANVDFDHSVNGSESYDGLTNLTKDYTNFILGTGGVTWT